MTPDPLDDPPAEPEPPTTDPEEANWLASEDEQAPPPWSALGGLAQLLLAALAAGALVLALLALAGAASWIFR